MRKQFVVITACAFLFVAGSAYATCETSDCVMVDQASIVVDAGAYGHTFGYGDTVNLQSMGQLGVQLNYGDLNSDGMQASGLAGWNSASSGMGHLVAGGEAAVNFSFQKMDMWGVDKVPVQNECGAGCLAGYFDSSALDVSGMTYANGYGEDVAAFGMGQMLGNAVVGDPADGNFFQFGAAWDTSGVGQGWKEVLGGADTGFGFDKLDLSGMIPMPKMP